MKGLSSFDIMDNLILNDTLYTVIARNEAIQEMKSLVLLADYGVLIYKSLYKIVP